MAKAPASGAKEAPKTSVPHRSSPSLHTAQISYPRLPLSAIHSRMEVEVEPLELINSKQSTLMGFFGKPRTGPIPRTASNSSLTATASAGPATSPSISVAPTLAPATNHKLASTSRPASSAAGSSPTLVDRVHDGINGGKRQASPLKGGGKEAEESDLSTPPSSPRRMNANDTKKEQAHAGDVDMDNEAGHPPSSPIFTVSYSFDSEVLQVKLTV